MTLRASVISVASCIGSLLFMAGSARAITLPDSGSCSTTSPCLQISNGGLGHGVTANSTNGYGVYGSSSSTFGVLGHSSTGGGVSGDSSSGSGVYGSSSTSYGVFGSSGSSFGVYGSSVNATGIVGQTTVTSTAVSAITALSGSDAGLAYWAGVESSSPAAWRRRPAAARGPRLRMCGSKKMSPRCDWASTNSGRSAP
jgi:hypothetical protein